MGNTIQPDGKRIFDDIYTFPQDSQDLADDIHEAYNLRVGTSLERQALPPAKQRPGMLWSETDTGLIYRTNGSGAWSLPGARGMLNGVTPTTVNSGVFTPIDLDDPGDLPVGMTWVEASKQLVVARAGRYRVMGAGRWQTNGTGYRVLQIQQNGNPLTGRSSVPAISGVEMMQNAWGIATCAAGDTIALAGQQTVGLALEFRGAQMTIEAF